MFSLPCAEDIAVKATWAHWQQSHRLRLGPTSKAALCLNSLLPQVGYSSFPIWQGCGEVTCVCQAFCHSWHEAPGYITQVLFPICLLALSIELLWRAQRAQTQIKEAQGKEQVLGFAPAAFLGCVISINGGQNPLEFAQSRELLLSGTMGVGPFFLWTHFCHATMVCSFPVPPLAGADPLTPQDFTVSTAAYKFAL